MKNVIIENRDGNGPGESGYPTIHVPFGKGMEGLKWGWRQGWRKK